MLEFEEWIAYPNRYAYVPSKDHATYSGRVGWWVSGWVGDELAVAMLEAREDRQIAVVEMVAD